MVEFGAGGTIAQPDDTTNNSPSGVAQGGDTTASTVPGTTASGEVLAASTVAPPNPRRKRRAKGWTCPVCRQRQFTHFCSDVSISDSYLQPSVYVFTPDFCYSPYQRYLRR